MRILDRCGALTGAAYVLLVGIGEEMSTSPGPHGAHPTGQQNIADMRWVADHPAAQIGVTLELVGFALFVLFIGYLCTRVRDAGWLATAALAGGILAVAIKLGSVAPILVAYLLRDEISPETGRVLFDLNGAAFVVTGLPTGLFVACAAGAALATRTLGRVLGVGGVVVGVAAVLGTAATGVHLLAANPLPFLFCLLWILAVSVRLVFQRTARPADVVAPDADVAAV